MGLHIASIHIARTEKYKHKIYKVENFFKNNWKLKDIKHAACAKSESMIE
jgi:hypothetical protein